MVSIRQEKTRQDFQAHEYLIYFIERPDRNWWDYVFRTRTGFRHCFLMQWCEWSQRWIMMDWRQSGTDFMIFFDFEVQMFLAHIGEMKGTVVKLRAAPVSNDSAPLISYCSNVISRFIGLGNSIILTPYGLYRRLLASGGEVVFNWRDEADE